MERFKNMFKTKAFRAGGYSAFAAILIIAIAVVLVVMTSSLPASFTKIDLTEKNIYSLSEETKTLAKSLKEDVTIYIISRIGAEDPVVVGTLERYEALSDKIKVEVKDPVVYPKFIEKYTSETVNLNSIIVECGDKSRYIPYTDMFPQAYNEDYSMSTSFDGEAKITAAIRAVTEFEATTLYIVSGHGETKLSDKSAELIENNNIESSEINLLAQSTDLSAASAVLIYEPKADISDIERTKLSEYVTEGGNLLLYTGYTGTVMPNLEALMNEFGVATSQGIILEGDQSRCVSGQPYYILPEIKEHNITTPIINANYFVLAPLAHAITILDEGAAIPILTTTDAGFLATKLNEDGSIDTSTLGEPDVLNIGVVVTKSTEAANGNIIWYSGSSMLESQMGANTDLFLNSINWMCDREDAVTIHAKSLDSDSLTVSTSAGRIWSIALVFIIPLTIIVLGVYVWLKRRRK